MALPVSGPLSINQIRNELSTSNGSLRALSALAGKSTPDSISEFYGYSNNSVTITGTYFWSYTTLSSNSGSGTITITGSSATFYARATIINGTPTVTANINIGGNTRSAVRSKTTGTTDSSALVLSPGVYSYTASLSQAQNSGIGGGLVFTQP